jgi:hypothetical protein
MSTTLKHLNLTERDFELIIDGLEELPNKNAIGEMMGDLLLGVVSKDDPEAHAKIKLEREARIRNQRKEQSMMKEDIKILQGKLLMLKRYLIEQDAFNQANDIINHLK